MLARRHSQRRVPEPRRVRRSRRTSRCRSSSSTRAAATSPRTRTRWCCVPDPDTGQGWLLRLRFVRSETVGPLFDRMALRIEAIASYCGLKGIFKLRAADVYEVLSIEPAPEEVGAGRRAACDQDAAALVDAIFTTEALQDLAGHINRADSLETLRRLDPARPRRELRLQALGDPGAGRGAGRPRHDRDARLSENGAGAEVRFGEGIAGMVAEARKPIRISGLMRGMLYAFAMHKEAAEAAAGLRRARRIPMPGLAESRKPARACRCSCAASWSACCASRARCRTAFTRKTRRRSSCSAATSRSPCRTCSCRSGRADAAAEAPRRRRRAGEAGVRVPAGRARRDVVYYAADECILLDGEYLIRSLPARILWRLLNARESTGPAGVHQPRAAARQVAESAGVEGQPREPPAAAAPPPRREVAPTSGSCRAPAAASPWSSACDVTLSVRP